MSQTSNGHATADGFASLEAGGRKIRVLVVDDQPLIRRGIALILATEPDIDVVGQAVDGIEALELSRSLSPDVVLMDLQMPRCGGVAATRAITSELPLTQVVVLTTFDADDMIFEAIRAGAQGYLLKDASEAEVLDAIRAVFRGELRLSSDIAQKVLREFRKLLDPRKLDPQEVNRSGPPSTQDTGDSTVDTEELTPREEQILELIAQGRSNKDIARSVHLAEGTVKNYVTRVLEKLHARTRTELAVKVLNKRA
jgi:DNA-binding NarL/FixJ family response regulator